ncbi:SCO family protein [Ferrimonas balearica]|uniref:SCO family protein n=1 Tax=Ferrimonas balearica TaxID=44012 RepID=UPI001C997D1B|nr:SCO family protein [Ferrimonas balearica]MBY5994033.1 SCO family protein [Ferrimonas balearica]
MKAATQWIVLFGIVALVAGLSLGLQGPAPRPQVSALWLEHPRPLPEFTLTDHRGERFDRSRLEGQWSLIFVGYTSCPDVCPTTMADLARVYPKLEASLEADAVQVVLLSVDPGRDSPEKLGQYVEFFRPGFQAVTGEHAQLYPFTQALGLVYALVDNPNGGEYLVDHSADLVLINPQGQVEAFFRPAGELGTIRKVSMAQVAADLPVIVDAYKGS